MIAKKLSRTLALILILSLGVFAAYQEEPAPDKILTFQDIMKFKKILHPEISEDGLWITYQAQPGRGDGEVIIRNLSTGKEWKIERGAEPVFSKDGRWTAVVIQPKAIELEKKKKKKTRKGMTLIRNETGETIKFENVDRFVFSNDSKWLAYHLGEEDKDSEKADKKKNAKKKTGNSLMIRYLDSGEEIKIDYVLSYSFNETCKILALVLAEPEGKKNGLYLMHLDQKELSKVPVLVSEDNLCTNLSWSKEGNNLGFISGTMPQKKKESVDLSLWIWDGKTNKARRLVGKSRIPEGWGIPEKNGLFWSKDGHRLFFGIKPVEFFDTAEKEKENDEEISEQDLFDASRILEKRGVDVWHWDDPFIIPHQKKIWPHVKSKTYLAVCHLDRNSLVILADQELPNVNKPDNPRLGLGMSDVPYRKEQTWSGSFQDIYIISLISGERKKIASRISENAVLSPEGRYILYYKDKHWHLYDTQKANTLNLTEKVGVPFYDEDHDYPSPPGSYGQAGWIEEGRAVLIYDKYDIWMFRTKDGNPLNLTRSEGRRQKIRFRLIRLDPEKKFCVDKESVLLSAYRTDKKNYGFYSFRIGIPAVEKKLEANKKFSFIAKAKKADVILYTRESFEEFPDLWVADSSLSSPRKISEVNPQISDYAWGSAELVEWNSADGFPLQGVLIKPAGFQPGKTYPVIVYFYRFFSQRLYEFNEMVVNHRPNFPFYTSNGYAIFLPDIRFEVGRPGYSATKCLVPGVQKLIDMGIADPDAIGLHGHSWSGYQAAFVITQTDIFACSIAGAPVSNMTSAYSGIRWGSGLARQFQYEMSQSRIGGSLWEYPERYIENSPVFFADRIHTPLLIMFGDEDGAVPWYQGIELYLAMRRLGKDCIFLQYRNEPHHPQIFANKLDYSIRMKEYFDHFLKGEEAAGWIKKGVPYRGN